MEDDIEANQETNAKRVSNYRISGDSLFSNTVRYWKIGEHRTGSRADLRTSEWIYSEFKKAGLRTSYLSFKFDYFEFQKCELETADGRLECFPLWPPIPTGKDGVLVIPRFFNDKTSLESYRDSLIVFEPSESARLLKNDRTELIKLLENSHPAAAVMLTAENLVAHNMPRKPQIPCFPVPVACAAGKAAETLKNACDGGKTVKLILDGRWRPNTTAKSVIGHKKGNGKLVVISTPQSGWFGCGVERGTGVALLLGLARWSAAHKDGHELMFLVNSGHELDHLGMENFLNRVAPVPEKVACWLHFGANVATRSWKKEDGNFEYGEDFTPRASIMFSKSLKTAVERGFSEIPSLHRLENYAVGELKDIMEHNYTCFGLNAANPFGHTRLDTPETTTPQLLERVAEACLKTIQHAIGS